METTSQKTAVITDDAVLPTTGDQAEESNSLPVLTFRQGFIGCSTWQRFALLPDPFDSIGELVHLDDPSIGLIVADPAWLGIDYAFELDETDAETLELSRPEDARVLCILTINRAQPAIYANLAGPLVLNWTKRLGVQVVLDHQAFPLRLPIVTGAAAQRIIDALTGEATDKAHVADVEAGRSIPPTPPHQLEKGA